MRVYVRKEDKQPILPGLIVTAIFVVFSILIFMSFFKMDGSLMDKLSAMGVELVFAIVFSLFSIYFLYHLIRRPVKYKACLINKEVINYKGRDVISLHFKGLSNGDSLIPSEYKCYTFTDDFEVGHNYIIGIKEFNWSIRYVKKDEGLLEGKNSFPMPKYSVVFLAIMFLLGCFISFCVLGIVFYTEYLFVYLVLGVIFSIVLFYSFKRYLYYRNIEKEGIVDENIN